MLGRYRGEGEHRATHPEAQPYDAHRTLGLRHGARRLARCTVRVGGEAADDRLLADLARGIGGDERELEGVEHRRGLVRVRVRVRTLTLTL